MLRLALISLVLVVWASIALADDTVETAAVSAARDAPSNGPDGPFVPARFAKDLDGAAAEIAFPNYTRDLSLFINCAAKIDTTGEVAEHFCLDYTGGADMKFRKAVDRFIESTEITPATVNGRPVPVQLYFRVFFGRQGDQYAVGLYPNWGDDADTYGHEYEAPQRYDQTAPNPDCRSDAGMSKVLVGTDGKARGEVELVMSYGVPAYYSTCEIAFSQAVLNGRYIPALRDGEAVAATYVEVSGDPSWFTLKAPPGL